MKKTGYSLVLVFALLISTSAFAKNHTGNGFSEGAGVRGGFAEGGSNSGGFAEGGSNSGSGFTNLGVKSHG